MRTIQLQVDDNQFDTLLTLLDNLKEGMIKNLVVKQDVLDDDTNAYIKTEDFKRDKEYLQTCLEDITSGKTQALSHDEVWNSIEEHTRVS